MMNADLLDPMRDPGDILREYTPGDTAQVLAALLERLSDAVCRRPGARAALQQAGGADPPTRSAQR